MMHDADGARAAFERAIELSPEEAVLRVHLAAAVAAAGRPHEAMTPLYEALAIDPDDPRALAAAQRITRQAGDLAASGFFARLGVRAVQARRLLAVEELVDFGEQLLAIGAWSDASSAFEAALADAADCAAAAVGLADAARGLAQAREGGASSHVAHSPTGPGQEPDVAGEPVAQTGIAPDGGAPIVADVGVNPTAQPDVGALWDAAYAARAAKDRRAALEAFEQLARLNAHGAALEAVQERIALGDPKGARAALEAAVLASPDDIETLSRLCGFELVSARAAAAAAVARRLISLAPGEARGHVLLALATEQAGEPAAALEQLDRAPLAADDPARAACRLEIARRFGDRRLLTRLATPRAPAGGEPFALALARASALIELGRLADAEGLLRSLSANHPLERAQAARLKARLLETRGRLDEAAEALLSSIEAHPENPEAHRELCRLMWLLVRPEQAQEHLNAYMVLDRGGRSARGEPLSSSQTLPGELLNELMLDPDLAHRLARIVGLPACDRVAPLFEIIREAPGSTSAAVQAIQALRLAGRLGDGGCGDGGGAIPGRIISRGADAPAGPSALPGLRSETFSLDGAHARLQGEAAAAFGRCGTQEQAWNLFVLAELHANGGWLSARPASLEPMVAQAAPGRTFVAVVEPFGAIGLDSIGAAAGDRVIGRALALAIEAIGRGDADIPWLATGPGLLARALVCEMAEQGEPWERALAGRVISSASSPIA
jgi:tetratricopeptide (TPR) repeat protein